MKKLLTALLLICMAFACSALAEEPDIFGNWYTLYFGQRLTLVVNEDGTYQRFLPSEADAPYTGTWAWGDGLVVLDEDNSTVLVPANDVLMMTDNLDVYTMTRTELPEFYPAQPNENAALEDYQGTWTAYRAAAYGMTVDMASSDLDLTMTIDGGEIRFESQSIETNEIVIRAAFGEGHLVCAEYNDANEAIATHTFQLLNDGSLYYEIQPDMVGYYFMKADA
ncbi:MAG: hypothetical protein E7317_03390 [Clostridiales bacterium]|nr:hypothetical protein [Clostridiales bacterium]